MPSSKYIPINCNLYDQLEAFAVQKTLLNLEVELDGSSKNFESVSFMNFITKKDGEYGVIKVGNEELILRLDKLISINDSKVRDEFGDSCFIPNKK